MDIFFNTNPRFTKWLVASGGLQEPFVVVDVGVFGGGSARWHFLGDHLIVHGFDPIKEAIDDLARKSVKSSNRTFHGFAIGNEDGDREFFFKPSNPTNSSFYQVPNPELEPRTVPVRRLDTLFKEGVIPKTDFLKVDVEGHERDVFWGAGDLLGAGVLGVETETSFDTSIIYPESHFGLIHGTVLKHGLMLFDLNFNRIRRAAYQDARRRRSLPGMPLEGAGKPATFNVLFCRDLTAERSGSSYYAKLPPPPSVDQILKMMAIYELHGLNDIAVDTAVTFADELGRRVDVERAIDLLCDAGRLPRAQGAPSHEYILDLETERAALKDQIDEIHASTSWRMTAPLRTLGNALKRMS
jgi:FkbM family methyltransferase